MGSDDEVHRVCCHLGGDKASIAMTDLGIFVFDWDGWPWSWWVALNASQPAHLKKAKKPTGRGGEGRVWVGEGGEILWVPFLFL